MKNKAIVLLALLMLCLGTACAQTAEDLTERCTITSPGKATGSVHDGLYTSYWRNREQKNGYLEFQTPEGESADWLYICFGEEPKAWAIERYNGSEWELLREDTYDYAHVLVPLGGQTHFRLIDTSGKKAQFKINEVSVFGPGEVPDWVQQWEPTIGKADILLVAAHPDDELLFFGGTIPDYGVERGARLLVAYMSSSNTTRKSELLNGLWQMGIRNYPVIGTFHDTYCSTLEDAYKRWKKKDVDAFLTELIRAHQPEVILTHDVNGEYGHGAHKLCADAVQRCIAGAADPEVNPESAQKYGTWQAKKLYLHLSKENPVHMDWNQPLSTQGGATGIEAAQKAYLLHVTQQNTHFEVTDSGKTSCAEFGLVLSTVGPDTAGGDFLENIDWTAEIRPAAEEKPQQEEPETEEASEEAEETEEIEETETEKADREGEEAPDTEPLPSAESEADSNAEEEQAQESGTQLPPMEIPVQIEIGGKTTVLYGDGLGTRPVQEMETEKAQPAATPVPVATEAPEPQPSQEPSAAEETPGMQTVQEDAGADLKEEEPEESEKVALDQAGGETEPLRHADGAEEAVQAESRTFAKPKAEVEWPVVQPELDDLGYPLEGETVYADDEQGIWFYASPSLVVRIDRIFDAEKVLTWYEAQIFCDTEKEYFGSILYNPERPQNKHVQARVIAKENQVVFAMNTDYYTYRLGRNTIIGVIVRDGKLFFDRQPEANRRQFPNLDTLSMYEDGHWAVRTSSEWTGEQYLQDGAVDVWCFGPYLVRDGEINPFIAKMTNGKTEQPRCGIGMIEPGHYFCLLAEGRIRKVSVGVDIQFLADHLLAAGCKEALNLDGGQTAVMCFMGEQITRIGKYEGNTNPRATTEVMGIGHSDLIDPNSK